MNESQEREAMLAEFHEWFFSAPGRPNSHWNPTLESWMAARAALPSAPAVLSDERIDFIADTVVKGMPDGIQGFCRTWGWRQFARAILEDCAGHCAQQPAAVPDFNAWFCSLTEGRQAVLREDKWILAEAAFNAGKEIGK